MEPLAFLWRHGDTDRGGARAELRLVASGLVHALSVLPYDGRMKRIAAFFLFLLACRRDGALGAPFHMKGGETKTVGGVTFTVVMLPKLMVSGGPTPEIEQVQVTCGKDVVQLDTLHKSGTCGGRLFELGYADVYQDDIELTVRQQ